MKKVDVLLGLQWGDEGKGKIVDVVTPNYNIIARFQGGPNAGHTLIFDDKKYVLHTIPSGIFRENTINVIGNGVVIDPIIIKDEIDNNILKRLNPSSKQDILVEGSFAANAVLCRLLAALNPSRTVRIKKGGNGVTQGCFLLTQWNAPLSPTENPEITPYLLDSLSGYAQAWEDRLPH